MDQTTGTSWPMHFEPRPLINSPRPELFDPAVAGAVGTQFRFSFTRELAGLVSPEIPRLRLQIFTDYAAGESSVDGPARPDYVARVVNSAAGTAFAQAIADGIAAFPQQPPCPADDPLTPAAILERATALTCAGCHAPQRLLSPERRVGCGQVWPLSLGEAHIDEQGRLSPALTDLLLPHRASVLTTYLQACDPDAIVRNLQPSPSLAFPECLIGGTEVTMADGSLKAIERIEPGEMVLSLDEASGRTVSARVERAFVRADTDGLIVVNGSVVATPNHAFRTERGWIAAEFLRANDVLVRARSTEPGEAAGLVAESAPVSALEMRRGSVTTYNLAVVRHHAFFAGGVLVHDGP